MARSHTAEGTSEKGVAASLGSGSTPGAPPCPKLGAVSLSCVPVWCGMPPDGACVSRRQAAKRQQSRGQPGTSLRRPRLVESVQAACARALAASGRGPSSMPWPPGAGSPGSWLRYEPGTPLGRSGPTARQRCGCVGWPTSPTDPASRGTQAELHQRLCEQAVPAALPGGAAAAERDADQKQQRRPLGPLLPAPSPRCARAAARAAHALHPGLPQGALTLTLTLILTQTRTLTLTLALTLALTSSRASPRRRPPGCGSACTWPSCPR